MKPFEFKSEFVNTLILLSVVCFSSCDKDSYGLPINPSDDVAQRSCQIVTQDWSEYLINLARVQHTDAGVNLRVSAIERTSDSTFIYHRFDQLVGKNIVNRGSFLFLVSNENLDGEIIGYYDPTNLQFCQLPDNSLFLLGELELLVQSKLGILGVDSESF